ncbi:dihydrolipoyl dehydrogenase [bacterium]|nr:dihydrolipoyl dehydrogenase [bacterium]
MSNEKFDLIVIGGGPGGYVAAIRAGQLGLKTACVDKNELFGGTCLRVGCIPSKALLESSYRYHQAKDLLGDHGIEVKGVKLNLGQMMARKDKVVQINAGGIDGLFKKNNVTGLRGSGRIVSAGKVEVTDFDGNRQVYETERILIATGSKPAQLKGVEIDNDRICGSKGGLSFPEVPETLVVIGAGYIGLELGSVWHRLGSKVIVLEYLDRILPGMDAGLAKESLRVMKKQGLEFRLGTKVTGAKVKGRKVIVEVEGSDPVECDRLLSVVGRWPNTDGLGAEEAGVKLNQRGQVEVDDHYRTNVDGIFAIGDVIHGPMLAHKAEEEGIACVEMIATGYGHVNYDVIPGIVYTHPEIATVGKTEEELKEAGIEYKAGKFIFKANGRAHSMNETDGSVKILADAKSDRVLGVHIIGPQAGDLIAECATAMEFRASAEDIARTCHAHPTLSEAVKEAAFAVDGRAIHGL